MQSHGSPDFLITADASQVSGSDFMRAVFGLPHTPRMTAAEREAWFANRRAENRLELEELRERLCKLASPKLAAEWRARWALEDAERDQREERRAA